MMRNLFYGEWIKLAGNRWATAFFVWIFPFGALILMAIFSVIVLFSDSVRMDLRMEGMDPWNVTILGSWEIINSIAGRWIIIVFSAFVFAGEYRHGTWKNMVTRRSRIVLILNKFFTLAVFITIAFVTMSLILGMGGLVVSEIAGVDYGLSTADEIMGDFLRDYALQAFTTITGVLISASFAAAASMVVHNILAASVVGIFFYMLEYSSLFIIFGLLGWLLGIDLWGLYRYLPSYNLDSVTHWVAEGKQWIIYAGNPNDPTTPALEAFDLEIALLIVIAWVMLLVGTTTYLFYRQDITT